MQELIFVGKEGHKRGENEDRREIYVGISRMTEPIKPPPLAPPSSPLLLLTLLLWLKYTRLQAQAAGVAYSHPMTNLTSRMMFVDLRCSPSCTRAGVDGTVSICPLDCFEYKGTLEGFGRIWRGTNAGLALAIPTVGIYLPCYDIFRNWFEEFAAENAPSMTPYAPLLAGSLSRSLACTTCYPIELARTRMQTFTDFNTGKKALGVWKMLLDVKTNGNLDIKLLH
uniref:Uncharacterized protein n=1 Tax=Lactuca sativa TaxID=4236 RepID=A0A9R1X303_LACSA|nr:hypothetical protein LSAT_V11C600315580 [Lactuca sativa]